MLETSSKPSAAEIDAALGGHGGLLLNTAIGAFRGPPRHTLSTIDKDQVMATRRLRRLVARRRDEIERIARAHGETTIRLVGSVARGDDDPGSDIDFLVRFEPGRSLFDQAGLIHDLEQLLGVDVDVISEGGLRPTDDRLRNDPVAL